MMGSQGGAQDRLFYSFNLEDHVPRDHLLRGVDLFLDLSELREHLASFYSHTGRPSIDPELMIRMLVIGYCFGIRSERRLCEEVHLNLAYRWFCRLDLEQRVPDHSTFSKNRHGRFRQSDAFRHLFESVLRRCMKEGLVGGEGFAIDASVIKADASRASRWTEGEAPTRAVREYLQALDAANPPAEDDPPEGPPGSPPRHISPTDPEARWTAAPGGPAFYAYSTNYLIDLDAGIIVDVEATPAHRTDEVQSTKTMIDRVERQVHLKPKRLVGDTAYGAAPLLNWIVNEKQIEPHIPVWEKANRDDGTFSRSDFTFDAQENAYTCPGGKKLNTTGRATAADTLLYRATNSDCAGCALKQRCCPNTPSRKIPRSVYEDARDVARTVCASPGYEQSRKDRKKVEMLFAHLKRILKLDRLRLRGLIGARDEFLMAAAAQNLRRMARWLGPKQGIGSAVAV
ncbi:transposase [Caenimonas sedimenti]|uniref:Transposase n=1 Tax=Caenimonas sedimenti TaxID=2596921 RepID=A0A562ZD38_9BURK|nr:transposase [Caenimonas sedimenti]TWO62673.1 transposase [Caenimonas sedimenti]